MTERKVVKATQKHPLTHSQIYNKRIVATLQRVDPSVIKSAVARKTSKHDQQKGSNKRLETEK